MRRANILAALLTLTFSGPVTGQSLDVATPRELQDMAIVAVDAQDADHLLEIMQEMQMRHLLFFTDPALENCDREPDRVGILDSKPFAWAGARQAYFTYLRQRRMAAGDCGCITAQMTFDEFALEFVGATAADMTLDQYLALQNFKNEQGSQTEDDYRAYRNANCEAE